jgi:hypothetical protein
LPTHDPSRISNNFENNTTEHSDRKGRGSSRKGISEDEAEERDGEESDEYCVCGERDSVEVVGCVNWAGFDGTICVLIDAIAGDKLNGGAEKGSHGDGDLWLLRNIK